MSDAAAPLPFSAAAQRHQDPILQVRGDVLGKAVRGAAGDPAGTAGAAAGAARPGAGR